MNKAAISEGSINMGYPSSEFGYFPSVAYPEYPWGGEISKEENGVYALVRECIHSMGYDADHYGTSAWNPFGDFIKEGDTVLIKPNWVDHSNKNKKVHDNLACLVTNPSVIRAIVDYVCIALKGTGRLIIADAPMQICDLQKMFKIVGYDKLFSFLDRQGVKYEIADLRKYRVEEVADKVFSKPILNEGSRGVVVDMQGFSLHSEKDAKNPKYKVTDHELSNTESYHSGTKHCYEINRLPLEADVIINVPKPKTHRLAGMTAACKNFVGITFEKASLPHRIVGNKSEGGDAYLKKSKFKELMEYCDERKTKNSVAGNYRTARFYWFFTKVFYVLGAIATGDKFRIGSWYGNDTIWRTSIDLNYILLHADKEGVLKDKKQRTIVSLGDMIIAGQGEGPVGPDPKPLGLIMMADNNLLFDRVMCEIMGFNHKKFPSFHHHISLERMGYKSFEELNSESVFYNGWKKVCDFIEKPEWHYNAHSCWKGYIEK